ncbi:lipoprotein N-acyltransferase Lnb domain-containing protein [Methylomonas sp. MgM2]
MKKIIKQIVWLPILIGITLWGMLAIYYGDSETNLLQTLIAAVFGFSGLLAMIGVFSSRRIHVWPMVHLILFVGLLAWWLAIEPRNDRDWQIDVARLASATIDGDEVTLRNIRNFHYRSEFDYQPAYYDKTFNISKLQGVDLFAFYWMGPAIAHTIMSFDFGDQGHLAVSIETRKEKGEEYSTIKGFFRQYELIYIVADERDVIALRTNFRNNPVEEGYLYKATGKRENAERLFLSYLKKINELREKPTFYNTLFDNCTVAIWLQSLVNRDHLPFSWKILLSGYLPEYLYESKRLDQQMSFEELQRRAHINSLAKAADQDGDFSARIRAGANQRD